MWASWRIFGMLLTDEMAGSELAAARGKGKGPSRLTGRAASSVDRARPPIQKRCCPPRSGEIRLWNASSQGNVVQLRVILREGKPRWADRPDHRDCNRNPGNCS